MTGDAPQPGETPRTEGDPWSFDPDAAWWRGDTERERADALAEAATRPRHPRRRTSAATSGSATPTLPETQDEPVYAEEAVDAHAAGVDDTASELTAGADPPPAVQVETEQAGTIEETKTETVAEPGPDTQKPATPESDPDVEHDLEDTPKSDHAPKNDDAPKNDHAPENDDSPETGRISEIGEIPGIADVPGIDEVPEIIARPEGDWNRPTVTLDRVPASEPAGRTNRLGQARISAAELNVKRSRVENSPFWLNDDGLAAINNAWPAPALRGNVADAPVDERRGLPPRHRARTPRAAAPGLFGLIALALIAAFFSWVSAEPFWLAVGHGDRGVATVTQCTGSGITQRCAGSFAAADGDFSSGTIGLLGVPAGATHPGAVVPARMVNPTSKQAYAGRTSAPLQVRWLLGFLLVALCGLGIAGLTGTRQLETVRARRSALLMSLAGPLVLLAGFLLATY